MFDILNGSADVRRVLSTESVEQIICQPRELKASLFKYRKLLSRIRARSVFSLLSTH